MTIAGPRIERVLQGRADANGTTLHQEKESAMSIKPFVDPKYIAALCDVLAPDRVRMISGQMLPIDGEAQAAS